jgi:hypothetical protein
MVVLDQPYASVLVMHEHWDDGRLITVHNLGAEALVVPVQVEKAAPDSVLVDLLESGTTELDAVGRCAITVGPFGYRWLRVTEPGSRRLV